MLARTDFLDFALIGTGPREAFWLQRSLGEHPSIAYAKGTSPAVGQKGPGYGKLTFEESGLERWRSRFVDAGPLTVLGMIDPDLIYQPTAAVRLSRAFPAMKLIAFLRDPAELLLDVYHSQAQRHAVPPRLIDAIEERPEWLDRARYHRHLLPFLDRFHPDQICLVIYERFFAEETTNYQRLCRYLGVDGEFLAPPVAIDVDITAFSANPLAQTGRNIAARLFASSETERQTSIDEATRWYILEQVSGELERLEKALAINLDLWRGKEAAKAPQCIEHDNIIPLPTGQERRKRLANRKPVDGVCS